MELVKIRDCQDFTEAQMFRAVLEVEGIRAHVVDEQVPSAILKGWFAQDGFASLWVFQSDVEKALAILEEEAIAGEDLPQKSSKPWEDGNLDEQVDLDEQARQGGEDEDEDEDDEKQASPRKSFAGLLILWAVCLPILALLVTGAVEGVRRTINDWTDWDRSAFVWHVIQILLCLILAVLPARILISSTRCYLQPDRAEASPTDLSQDAKPERGNREGTA